MLSDWIIIGLYAALLSVLAIYGAHRVWLILILRRSHAAQSRHDWTTLPSITVQLPVFNEAAVIARLIDAACALDWPRDRLQIQILDDSTDRTTDLAQEAAAAWRSAGLDISVIRRTHRTGYKAGALAAGLETAKGEFVAIFDADFVPPADFLHQLMPHFTPEVGMVQARWGHLNRDESLLTRLQALLLDGHFLIEHTARHRSGCFFNFNGTAGIWRLRCIHDAGGWAHDTITEDLDLSYRAQLHGWRFVYLPACVVPGELPLGIPAFLTQQHRWAKGTIQTSGKLLGRILRSPLPIRTRLEALMHLSSPLGYPVLVLLALLLPPAIGARSSLGLQHLYVIDSLFVVLCTGSMMVFYGSALCQQEDTRLHRLWEVPLTLALGVGMAASQTIAVVEGILWKDTTFIRTPKHGSLRSEHPTVVPRGRTIAQVLTWSLALYYAAAIPWAITEGHQSNLPFMLLFAVGFGGVGIGLIPEFRYPKRGTVAATETDVAPAAK